MDIRWKRFGTAMVAVLLCGCATQTIQQSANFAKAGTDYCETVGGFLDVYLVTRLDVNSRRALVAREHKLKAALAADLPKDLERADAAALEAVRQTGQVRANVGLLRAYFESLNALATSDAPTRGGAALKSLGAAINDVNTATGGDAKRFTAEQLGSIEKIGKLAVRAAVAAELREALAASKEAVAWQLAWQEMMLATLAKPVRDDFAGKLEAFHATNIAAPYTSATGTPGTTWIDERRKWAQARFQIEAFDKASAAAAHMRKVWEDLIAGHQDIHSIRLMLLDLQELTSIVRTFHEAEKAK